MKDQPGHSGLPFPQGHYASVVIWRDIAFVSGHVSRVDGKPMQGSLIHAADIPHGQAAARVAAGACLRALEAQLGTLDTVERMLSVRGFLATSPTFEHHSRVLDAASDVLMAALPGRGLHARCAVGVSSLPGGGLVEIEMMIGLRTR